MDRVLQRRDTAANWSTTNPILAEGEIGIITDGAKGYKIGDGVTRWNALEYPANPTSVVGELGNSEVAVMNQKIVTESITNLNNSINYNKYDFLQSESTKNIDIEMHIKPSQTIRLYVNDIVQDNNQTYIIRSINDAGVVVETYYSNVTLYKDQLLEITPTLEATKLRIIVVSIKSDGYLCITVNIVNNILSLYDKTKANGAIISSMYNSLFGITCNFTSEQQNQDITLDIKADQMFKIFILDITQDASSNYIIRSVTPSGNVIETFKRNITLATHDIIEINPTKDAGILRIIRQTAGIATLQIAINMANSLENLYKDVQTIENKADTNSINIEKINECSIDLLSISQKNYYYNESGIKTYTGGLYATTNKVRHDGMKRVTVKGNTHSGTNVPVIIPFDINGNVIQDKIVYGTSPVVVLPFSLELTEDIYMFVAQTRFALDGASITLTYEDTIENIVNEKREYTNIINRYVANTQRAILNRFTSYMDYQKVNEQQIDIPSEVAQAAGIRIPSIQILSNKNRLLMALVNIGSVGDFSEFKEYVYILNQDNSIKQKYEFVDNMPDLEDGIAYPTTCMVNGTVYLFYTKITQDSNANVTASATYVRTTEDGITWSNAELLNNEAGFLCGGGSKAFEEDGIIYVPFLMRSNNKKDSGFLAYNISEKSCYIKMLNADLGTDECSIYPDGLGNILISTRMTDGTLQGLYKVSKDEYNHGYEKMNIDTSDRLALQECCLYVGNGIVLRTRATDPSGEGGWQRGSQILEISYDFGITFKKICDISGIENKLSGGYTSLSYYDNEICISYEFTPYNNSTFKVTNIQAVLSQNVSLL